MEITVYDLCNLYIESGETMRIWCEFDAGQGGDGIVFEGTFSEAAHSDWEDCEVESFGIENGMLVVNVA